MHIFKLILNLLSFEHDTRNTNRYLVSISRKHKNVYNIKKLLSRVVRILNRFERFSMCLWMEVSLLTRADLDIKIDVWQEL